MNVCIVNDASCGPYDYAIQCILFYIELPVLSVHLDRPFRVPSAMCPRFVVAKLTYPMPINCWL